MKPESKGGAYLQKRTWSIGVVLLLVVFLLTGCGRDAPEMEFASADEAKEALSTASTIEIYTDLYSKRRETKILADGKVAGYVKWNTVYIDDQEWFSVEYTSDVKGEKSSTGYGYYDAEGNCLGCTGTVSGYGGWQQGSISGFSGYRWHDAGLFRQQRGMGTV